MLFLLTLYSVSFGQSEQIDSLTTTYTNNLHFKPRLLIGTGMSTPVNKYDTVLRLIGALNLRLCSDIKSWQNRSASFFMEAGTVYFNTSIDRSDENSLILYVKFGPEIKIINYFFISPFLGGFGLLNSGPESNNPFVVGLGLSLNYSFPLYKNISFEFEGGTNLFPQDGGYPNWTPYLVVGISI